MKKILLIMLISMAMMIFGASSVLGEGLDPGLATDEYAIDEITINNAPIFYVVDQQSGKEDLYFATELGQTIGTLPSESSSNFDIESQGIIKNPQEQVKVYYYLQIRPITTEHQYHFSYDTTKFNPEEDAYAKFDSENIEGIMNNVSGSTIVINRTLIEPGELGSIELTSINDGDLFITFELTNYKYNVATHTHPSGNVLEHIELDSTYLWYVNRLNNCVLPPNDYYLESDLYLNTDLTIEAGKVVNICLNGHSINLQNNQIINNGTLNIYDCSTTATTNFTYKDYSWQRSYGQSTVDYANFNKSSAVSGTTVIKFNGAAIYSNNEYDLGSNVDAIKNNGTLNIDNVNFVGIRRYYGAINNAGTATIKNSKFIGGFNTGYSAAIYSTGTSLTLENVEIKYNKINNFCSGIYLKDTSATLDNVTISDNKISTNESNNGAVVLYNSALTLKNKVVVSNNIRQWGETPTYNNNLKVFDKTSSITFSNLNSSSNIGISTSLDKPITLNSTGTSGLDNCFKSDEAGYGVSINADNKIVIAAQNIYVSKQPSFNDRTVKITAPEGKTITYQWYKFKLDGSSYSNVFRVVNQIKEQVGSSTYTLVKNIKDAELKGDYWTVKKDGYFDVVSIDKTNAYILMDALVSLEFGSGNTSNNVVITNLINSNKDNHTIISNDEIYTTHLNTGDNKNSGFRIENKSDEDLIVKVNVYRLTSSNENLKYTLMKGQTSATLTDYSAGYYYVCEAEVTDAGGTNPICLYSKPLYGILGSLTGDTSFTEEEASKDIVFTLGTLDGLSDPKYEGLYLDGNKIANVNLNSSDSPKVTLSNNVPSKVTLPKEYLSTLSGGNHTITLRINQTSYYSSNITENFDFEIKVTPNNKIVPGVNAPTGISNLVYNGQEQTLINAGVTTGGTMMYSLDGVNYSTDLPKAKNAKTYDIYYKVVGNDTYKGVASKRITVSIAKKDAEIKANDYTRAWDGNQAAYYHCSAVVTGNIEGETLEYSLGIINASSEPGEYVITVGKKTHEDSNYNITYTNGKYTITKLDNDPIDDTEVTATAETISKQGNGLITIQGIDSTDLVEYKLSTDNGYITSNQRTYEEGGIDYLEISNLASGTYNIRYKEDAYYYASEAISVKVNQGPRAIVQFDGNGHTITAIPNQSVDYGDKITKPDNPTITGYKFVSWNEDEATTDEWDFTSDTIVGNKTLYAKWVEKDTLLASQFTFKEPSNLTYTGNVKEVGVEANAGVTGIGTITVKYYKNNVLLKGAPTDAGTYTVKIDVSEGDDYLAITDLTDSSWTFTITKGTASCITPSTVTWEYDGTDHSGAVNDANASVTYKTKTSVEGTYSTFTGVPSIKNVGKLYVEATVTETDNYNAGTFNYTLEVTKKDVTITANNNEKTYGDVDPKLTCIENNVVSGEKLSYTVKRDAGENCGRYVITIELGNNPNYNITANPGYFDINPKSLLIKTGSAIKYYDGTPLTCDEVTFDGFVEGEGIESYDLPSITEVGLISNEITNIVFKNGTLSTNYNIGYDTGVLKILPVVNKNKSNVDIDKTNLTLLKKVFTENEITEDVVIDIEHNFKQTYGYDEEKGTTLGVIVYDVNNKEILTQPDQCIIEEGSVKITLPKSYLKTLAVGSYKYKIMIVRSLDEYVPLMETLNPIEDIPVLMSVEKEIEPEYALISYTLELEIKEKEPEKKEEEPKEEEPKEEEPKEEEPKKEEDKKDNKTSEDVTIEYKVVNTSTK